MMPQTREERNAKQRAYNAAHKKEISAYNAMYHAKYRDANRSRLREKAAAYRTKNRKSLREKYVAYYAAHREVFAAQRVNPELWPALICKDIRARAKKEGTLFDMVPDDIKIPSVCPFTLRPFYFGPRRGTVHPQAPSVDRIKPELGYVRGNVRVISYKANTIKNDCTDPDVFQRLADDARLWSLV